jgi:Transposase DDE domain
MQGPRIGNPTALRPRLEATRGQRTYSDVAIEAAMTIRMVSHLPLLQTEGFLGGLADLLDVDLPIPGRASKFYRTIGAVSR